MATSKYNIQIKRLQLGHDRVYLIYGGQAHIGAVVTAYFHHGEVQTQLQALPGHREDQLALELAEYAASQLKVTVTVVMGIHFDRATKEMIQEIVEEVRGLMHEEIGANP
ncbi:hypothetical protein [Ammoniphilus sp. YIM 78166]|uniref:prenylated flavin chaperone LpdD n=1 Tax=Ammoniphilus sp. YIM 78166 TaxID=1644106 RepID=UPI00106FFCF2|nr:hypothetical protein [Ammoniphilus sp. YIM 78166]